MTTSLLGGRPRASFSGWAAGVCPLGRQHCVARTNSRTRSLYTKQRTRITNNITNRPPSVTKLKNSLLSEGPKVVVDASKGYSHTLRVPNSSLHLLMSHNLSLTQQQWVKCSRMYGQAFVRPQGNTLPGNSLMFQTLLKVRQRRGSLITHTENLSQV